ncbi:hypothetical protein TPA0908_51030 [Micromonospora sp. AKA38]|nr:hypothetical protein TPA0908_51030 [Micromonospora sp. AKA38]
MHGWAGALGRAPIPARAAGTGDGAVVADGAPGVTPADPGAAVDAAGSAPDAEQPAVNRASTTTAARRGRGIPAILPHA